MQQGILTDRAIFDAIRDRTIEIEPFNPDHVNITSYDLTLGDEVAVYNKWVMRDSEARAGDGSCLMPIAPLSIMDCKDEPEVSKFTIDPERGWVLKPGIGYLMHTRERVRTCSFNPILDGKSSIGRLFIQVHATAGYGDPGFNGQYTLEVFVQHPVRVYPGMRFCQIRFHTLAGTLNRTYDCVGHYVGNQALGANPSQAWKQFR